MYCAWCGTPVAAVSYTLCSNCGRPTNGAQPGTAPGIAAPRSNSSVVIIVVVIAAVLAIPMIGILSAIAIPNLLTAMQRSKQKRTMADIRTIGSAVEAFAHDKGTYPRVGSIDELEHLLGRTDLPRIDGWGAPLHYACTQETPDRCAHYAIASGGKDLRLQNDDLSAVVAAEPGATTKFDCDIVFADGEFIEYPVGVQH